LNKEGESEENDDSNKENESLIEANQIEDIIIDFEEASY